MNSVVGVQFVLVHENEVKFFISFDLYVHCHECLTDLKFIHSFLLKLWMTWYGYLSTGLEALLTFMIATDGICCNFFQVLSQRTCSCFRRTATANLFDLRWSSHKLLSPLNDKLFSTYSGSEIYSSKRRSRGPVMAAKKASEGTKLHFICRCNTVVFYFLGIMTVLLLEILKG